MNTVFSNPFSFPWRPRTWHGLTIEDAEGVSVAEVCETHRLAFIVAACNLHGELAETVRELLARMHFTTDVKHPLNYAAVSRAVRVMGKVLSNEALREYALRTHPQAISSPADTYAMQAIHALLDRQEHDAETIVAIAELVRATGREVRDLNDEEG